MKKKAGIYYIIIECENCDRIYIGKDLNIHKQLRIKTHLSRLERKKHPNKFLSNAYEKYGKEKTFYGVFENTIIEYNRDEKTEINKTYSELEKNFIKKFSARENSYGFNFTDGGDGCPGLDSKKRNPAYGAKCHFAIFTENEIREIRENYWKNSYSFPEMVLFYNASKQSITSIILNKTYKNNNYTPPSPQEVKRRGLLSKKNKREKNQYKKLKITLQEAKQIRELYLTTTKSFKEIGDLFGVSLSSVDKIVKNVNWYDKNYVVPDREFQKRRNKIHHFVPNKKC
jgi:predicted DNA-binding protein YlxM (UPF0122 family)